MIKEKLADQKRLAHGRFCSAGPLRLLFSFGVLTDRNDFSGLISRISVPSLQEIDQLVEGLRQMREKLDSDGDRLQREMAKYAEFSEAVTQLTKIVSDGMAHVKKGSSEGEA